MSGARHASTAARTRLTAIGLLLLATLAYGRDQVAGPDGYLRVLAALQPGDTLTLEPGTYRQGLPLHGLNGTPNAPIVVEGPSGGDPAVLLARPGANTVSLVDSSHVILRNLRIDGAHLPVDGIKAEGTSGPVHHITLERLTLVNQDQAQDIVAISTKCPAWGWIIRDNDIIGAGTGLYLGSSDGSMPFFDGIIERNVVVDTIGYNIEIKHQARRPKLPPVAAGTHVTVLRQNVFAKSRNASAGQAARPNVLVGHFPLQGDGRFDRYEIADNVFFANPTEALFQGEGNLILARNLFFNPHGDAIALQPHHDRPRNVMVVENFVAAAGRGIVLRGGDPGSERRVTDNVVYAADPAFGGAPRENVIGSFAEAPVALAPWVGRNAARGHLVAWERARLDALALRICTATASGTLPSDTRHPLCAFIVTLAEAAR